MPKPVLGEKRVKATRACDNCKKKKSKCSGERPCDRCSDNGKDCTYMSEYTRGREPHIPLRISLSAEQMLKQNPKTTQLQEDGSDARDSPSLDLPDYPQIPFSHSHSCESDSQEFVSSSGSTLYDRVNSHFRRKMSRHQKSAISMFGDPPLPDYDASLVSLPSAAMARALVDRYFEVFASTIRFLHRPTIDKWMESYHTDLMGSGNWSRSARAILLMILATAQDHMDGGCGEEDLSIRYFLSADYLLQYETGEIGLSSIQARLMQCYFLLSRSRGNQSWSIFGTVVNMCFAIGLHRKHNRGFGEEMDLVQVECRKRTFWSAYTLDKYISNCFGRPQMIRDEDIDQELPLSACDGDLQIASITSGRQLDVGMQATIFQITLSITVAKLLRDLYGLRPPDKQTRLTLTEKHQHLLDEWRQEVAASFGFDFPHEPPPNTIAAMIHSQNAVLMLTYYHVIILLCRPFLLETFSEVPSERARMKRHVQQCLDACMSIVEIVDRIYQKDPSFRARWLVHFCGYTAVICLYVYVIRTYEQPPETWTKYLDAGQKCQLQIDISAPPESFAQRCIGVLRELESETLDCLHRRSTYSQYSTPPVLIGLDVRRKWGSNTVIDRIDSWGFSRLTGY